MRSASGHQTAAHSSSHGMDVDSEGARVDYRPGLQAILRQPQKKFNVATSNNRDQMESETSELEEVGPISGRTSRVVVDGDMSPSLDFGVPLTGTNYVRQS